MKTRRMLQLLNVFVAIVIVIGNSLSGATNVLAQTGSAAASVETGSESRAVGETLTVDITIDLTGVDSPDNLLGSYTGSLSWDPTILDYQGYSGAPPTGFSGAVNESDVSQGEIVFNGANASGAAGETLVISINFSTIGEGTSALDLEFSAMAAATTFNSLLSILTVEDQSVTVNSMLPGTVTLEGDVSTSAVESGSSISFAHTTGADDNRLLLVGASWNSFNDEITISSVTFTPDGGSPLSLTEVITEQHNSNYRYAVIYSLLAPPQSQSGTVEITFTDSVGYGIVAGAANFACVDQGDPLGTASGDSSGDNDTTPIVTLSGLDGYELVFDVVFLGGDPPEDMSADASQTEVWNLTPSSSYARGAASTEQATGDSVTMSWTAADDSMWVIAAVPINPAMVEQTTYDLTIAASPGAGGTTDPAVGVHTFIENSVVDISATPATGYEFTGWSGDCSGTGSCQVTMDGDKSVTANFAQIEYALNISVVGNGLVSKNPDQTTYHYGDSVELTATPDEDWYFSAWSGDLVSSDNPDTILITGEANVTATFVDEIVGEVVVDGAASSSTANDTNSISFSHTTGTGVNRLMLVGVSWNSGDTTKAITSVEFSYDSTVLTFSEVITEEVEVSGTVSGPRYAAIYQSSTEPPQNTTGTLEITFDTEVENGIVAGAVNFMGVNQTTPLGTPVGANGGTSSDPVVTLTGLAGSELVFDNVFLGGSDDSYTLTVGDNQTELWNDFNENTRGTASIEQASGSSVEMSWVPGTQNWWAGVAVPINPAVVGTMYDLTMSIDPAGGGTTSPAVGIHSYVEDSVVSISATPAVGYEFVSWSGDVAEPSSASTTVTMDGDKTVTANFVLEEYDLTIDIVGSGSVSKDPDKTTYNYGDSVELTAVASSGWVFTGWSGALSGIVNPETLEITGDTTVTATFVEDIPGTIIYLGDVGSATIKEESATLVVTTDAAVAEGDDIIISYATGPHPDLELTVTDSVGNTYEQIELGRSYEYGRTYIFAAFNVTALPAGSQITITSDIGSGSSYSYPEPKAAIVSVFKGLADIEIVDQTLGNPTYESESAVSSSDPYVGPTGTTAQETELVVAALGTNGPVEDDAGTWGYDFITGDRVGTTGGDAEDNWTVSMAYKIVDSIGTFTAQKTGVTERYYAAVIATFKAEEAAPEYDLTIAVDPAEGGTTDPSEGVHSYVEDTSVTITPTPATGYEFSHWSGTDANDLIDNGDGTWSITMDEEKSIIANFVVAEYTLAVEISPSAGGDVALDPDQATYIYGDVVVLTPAPALGYVFDSWTGDDAGDLTDNGDGTWSITMDEDKSLTANFVEEEYTLAVTILPSAGGSVTLNPDQAAYTYGDVVILTPSMAIGYNFDGWTGDDAGDLTDNGNGTWSITMDEDKSLTANFVEEQYTLAVAISPSAGGSVTFNPDQATYTYGNAVVLTPVPAFGYLFDGWTGNDVGDLTDNGDGTWSITMNEDKSLTANFIEEEFTLAVAISPSAGGSVTLDPDQTTYTFEDVVVLTPVPALGYVFFSWTGDDAGDLTDNGDGTWSITMDDDKSLTANFVEEQYTLAVAISPSAGGSVTFDPDQATYTYGDVVVLTPVSAVGHSFDSWAGDDVSDLTDNGDGTWSITMNGDKSLTANFALLTYELTIGVDPVMGGTTNPTTGVHTYDYGDEVTITATENEGYEFSHWGGSCSGSGECVVTMDGDTSVTAYFDEITYDLTITVDPTEGGTTVPSAGVHSYLEGAEVVVVAEPAEGYEFTGWSGDCSGTGSCYVIMTGDKNVTANFQEIPKACFVLNLSYTGLGDDIVASPINSEGCSVGSYEEGEVITLTASPSEFWHVGSWVGTSKDDTGDEENTLIMPDGDTNASVQYEIYFYIPVFSEK